MKPTTYILAGIVAVLVGLGFVMPAIAQWRELGFMPGSSVVLLLLGFALTVGGFFAGRTGLRLRKS